MSGTEFDSDPEKSLYFEWYKASAGWCRPNIIFLCTFMDMIHERLSDIDFRTQNYFTISGERHYGGSSIRSKINNIMVDIGSELDNWYNGYLEIFITKISRNSKHIGVIIYQSRIDYSPEDHTVLKECSDFIAEADKIAGIIRQNIIIT